jgi:hypothetical protein
MKKVIILSVILSITIFACNPLKPDLSKAVVSTFSAADSIPRVTALAMIAHYMDTPQVNHSLDTLVRQMTLQNSDLHKIFKLKNITRIRLLDGAYLDTDPVVARRNKVMVLVQLKQGYNSNYYYYDIESFGADRICPPPPGCGPEQ